MKINPYCRDFGWLFEDLKASLCEVDLDGVEVVGSEEPLPDADAWICIRTDEAGACPDLSRCVVQVHDYRFHGVLGEVARAGGSIQWINRAQSHLDEGPLLITREGGQVWLPIGPRSAFKVRESMPKRPTVGWVGRDVVHEGRHIKRPELFVEVVRELRAAGVECEASIASPDVISPAPPGCTWQPLADRSVSVLQSFYHSIDVLVSTTEPEPGPLSIYEALACGVPVVSTPTGAVDEVNDHGRDEEGRLVGIAEVPAGCAMSHFTVAFELGNRYAAFRCRHEIANSVAHLSQETWARRSVELAVEVARG